ncbi:MAG: tetratricopeptide repeat protein [Acidobacteriia bacterium]|nr:tetratricopeptide repeat protein [Terriglobia bacterium]
MRRPTGRLLQHDWNSTSDGDPNTGPLRKRFATLLLFLLSLLLYLGTTGFDFVVDDTLLVAQNPYVLSFHFLKQIFSQDFWGFRSVAGATGYYRPLVMFTLLGERTLFGLNPSGYHLVNAILNGLVTILVYRLARRLWPKGSGPLWAGAIFAALPLHTENVAPVSGISDLECALFLLLSVWIYIRPGDSGSRLSRVSCWLAAALFLLAVLSKEVALVLPLLLIFYDAFVRSGSTPRPRLSPGRYLPFALAVAFYLALRLVVFGSITKFRGTNAPGWGGTILSALGLTGTYAVKLVWPQHLTYLAKFPAPKDWFDPYVVLGGALLLLAATAFFRYRREYPALSFAVLWFWLFLAPVLNVHWLGRAAYGERYLYLPSVAFCWLVGEGLAQLSRSVAREQRERLFLARAIPWVVLALLIGRTALRLPDWRGNKTLALATLREVPDSAMSHNNLGNSYRQEGNRTLARQQYVAAIASDPSLFEAYVDLALVLQEDGAVEGARAMFRRAAQVNPGLPETFYGWGLLERGAGDVELARQLFARAVALNPSYGDALNGLGVISMDQGRLDEAQRYLAAAAQTDPYSLSVHLSLGILYSRKGDFRQAEAEFRRASELAPRSEAPFMSLAGLYEQQGRQPEALEMYERAVQVHPSSSTALFRLGVLALKMGNVMKATGALEEAERLQPSSPLVHTQLGLAYRAAGRLQDARNELETSLRLTPDDATTKQALRELK